MIDGQSYLYISQKLLTVDEFVSEKETLLTNSIISCDRRRILKFDFLLFCHSPVTAARYCTECQPFSSSLDTSLRTRNSLPVESD